MNTSELNKKTQIDEGPCDIALPAEIKKMTADQFSKYAIWKKKCERDEAKSSVDEIGEGHRTLPPIDTERYTERKGLEGPMRARNGRVVYYDPKEGQYYDPDTDIYISNDEWEEMNINSEAVGLEDFELAEFRATLLLKQHQRRFVSEVLRGTPEKPRGLLESETQKEKLKKQLDQVNASIRRIINLLEQKG